MPFPAPAGAFPTGHEMADYLEAYAERMELPVRGGVVVDAVQRLADGYLISARERRFEADNVVVATGAQHLPKVPGFAGELDPDIRQLHSDAYRNPGQLLDGPVLVVGASHSGADLALEAAATHRTWLSGPDTGQVPFRIEGRPAKVALRFLWFAAKHVLTVRTPIGRKAQPEIRSHGGPLLRVKTADLAKAGVERVHARTVGVRDGKPLLDDGTVLDVRNVIWCTGFRRDFSWIDPPVLGDDGWPAQVRGVSTIAPGLYFMGLLFQHSFSSMLIGGAGRDAAHVAKHIAGHSRTSRPANPAVA
jgi:putative flavoprotein involved in K+ transport